MICLLLHLALPDYWTRYQAENAAIEPLALRPKRGADFHRTSFLHSHGSVSSRGSVKGKCHDYYFGNRMHVISQSRLCGELLPSVGIR
jgi:hypothetical protein